MEKKSAEILELLRSKNHCLDRLMGETRTFLAAPLADLVLDSEDAPGPLSAYEGAREKIIRTLELHDKKIGELIAALRPSEKTPDFTAAAREEMLRNERLILSVFNADDVVFRKIGDAQNQILRLIRENKKNRDIFEKFKSIPGHVGEEMDQTL
jgi:hypothetical protein